MTRYLGKEETYPYSSFGIYLGLSPDKYNIIDKSFIQGLFQITDPKAFALRYHEFTKRHRELTDINELRKSISSDKTNECVRTRNVIVRERSVKKVISIISDRLISKSNALFSANAQQKFSQYRAFTAFVLRVLCGLRYKEICAYLFNITISACSRLCDKGHDLLRHNNFYNDFFIQLANASV